MEEFLAKLEALKAGKESAKPRDYFTKVLGEVADGLAQAFSLRASEIALFLFRERDRMLRFAYPLELFEGGLNAFPVNNPSIAGQAFRSGKGVIINRAADVKHLGFYEQVRVGDEDPKPIQKLMAAVLPGPDGKAIGVVELSRRGKDLSEAGPDFSPQDFVKLEKFCAGLAPYLVDARPPDF